MTHYMTESANCTNNSTFLWQRLLKEEYFRPGRAVKHKYETLAGTPL